jgi:tRNA threonylcarbamoyladenosine modification (KEOPS) complex  Pcc1 subunit
MAKVVFSAPMKCLRIRAQNMFIVRGTANGGLFKICKVCLRVIALCKIAWKENLCIIG